MTDDPNVQTVLVGTALDAGSDRVVAAARELARVLGARLRLLHALIRPADLSGAGDSVQVLRREEAERALAAQAERLGLAPPELAGTVCSDGPPHRLLVEAARHGGADLIVVGAHEGLGLSGMFGSTASRVLRNATRPVLVVRGDPPRPPKRVLMPVDLSALSADAFRAGLVLIDAWADGTAVEAEALFVLTETDRRSHEAGQGGDAHAAAVASLARFVASHRGDFSGEIAQRVVEGDPRSEILYRTGVSQPDLVVLGTHGRSGFELLLMGSVAEGVVRETGCSTLVIPPDAALRAALARESTSRRRAGDAG